MSAPTLPVRSVTDGGLETDLIFHHGVELPDFAAFVLLDDDDGRRTLREYYLGYVEIARAHHAALRLETPTWRASADWGTRLGYDADALRRVNADAVRLLQQIAAESDLPTVRIVGMIGPRGDGYRSGAWDPETGPDDAYRYHRDQIRALPWGEVDIQREFGCAESIHNFVETQLSRERKAVVFYDHRAGEIADFVLLTESPAGVNVALHHCKGSSGAEPGDRIDDLYDLCGQVIKSVKVVNDGPGLLKHMRRRAKSGSPYLVGDEARAVCMLSDGGAKPLRFQIVAVQPGISKKAISGDRLVVLGAADEAIVRAGAEPLAVWASA